MVKKFIIGIIGHELLGYLPYPYYIEIKQNHGFLPVEAKLSHHNHERYAHLLTSRQLKMVQLCNEYSEQTLHKLFCKKKKLNARDFFESIETEQANQFIIPYIQKRVLKVIDLLMEDPEETPLFFKGSRKFVNRDEQVFIQPSWCKPYFTLEKTETHTRYVLSISCEQQPISLIDKPSFELVKEPARIIIDNTLYRFTDLSSQKIKPFFQRAELKIPASSEKTWYEKFGADIVAKHQVKLINLDKDETLTKKEAHLFMKNNLKSEPVLALSFCYNQRHWFESHSQEKVRVSVRSEGSSYLFEKLIRPSDWEQTILTNLQEKGLTLTEGNLFQVANIPVQTVEAIINWLRTHDNWLKSYNIEVHQEELKDIYSTAQFKVAPEIIEQQDWFDIYIKIVIGKFSIPFLRFRQHIIQGIKEYRLPDGSIFIIPDSWFSKFRDYLTFGNRVGEHIQLSKHHFQLLHAGQKKVKEEFLARYEELIRDKGQTITEAPLQLQAQMRTYQQQGYSWMLQLKSLQFGGCLADDMGLGKTLQTISLLCKIKEERMSYAGKRAQQQQSSSQLSLFQTEGSEGNEHTPHQGSPTSLVVMPTALIFNWQNEIKKFAPHLRVYVHTGTNRTQKVALFDLYDVVLTTYGVIRNDIEVLQDYLFDYIILDESQYIKNAASKAYKALMQMHSVHRLVLTGTPIENSLTDLWSQINFLNKGLLGNLGFFKKEFVTPIEKHKDEQQRDKLKLMIAPFVLRRTKHEVAKDLPDKTEQTIYCQMSKDQEEIYEQERSKIRNQLLDRLTKEQDKPTMLAIEGLSRLRQLANHPQMIFPDYQGEAGKYNEVLSSLESILAEGHKVLIFSAYLKQLNLFAQELADRKVGYVTLTGQTQKREEVIKKFTKEEAQKVFLIQIKAGGVGLNLTAADYVFILDPWWNPAVEEQAINRTHRIGQDKKVFVYRFLTLGTVEEKIKRLQTNKSALAKEFINTDDMVSKMNLEKILDIIS